MVNRVVLIGAFLGLAVAVTACRGDLTGTGISDQGVFFVEVGGHKDTSHSGRAAFYKTFVDGADRLSLYFVNNGSRFQMSFSIRDFRGEPEVYDLSIEPDRYNGTFSYTAAGSRVTYSIEGGTITFEEVSRFEIRGRIDFEGVATTGPNPGSIGEVSGTFTAVCEGECLGSGEPPPDV